MKRAGCLALALALSACNGSDEQSTPPASGTIMGAQFTPADAGALITPAAPCDIPGLGTRSLAVLAMGFSSFANLCGFVTTTNLCGDVASSLVVSATILRAAAVGTAAPIAPGTYALGTSVDVQGTVVATSADITKLDAVCASAAAIPDTTGGSITITAVSPRVTGTLDVSFTDGSRFAGSFDLPVCVTAASFCTLIAGTCPATPCCSSATTCP